MKRLRIDIDKGPRVDLRSGVGLPHEGQPVIGFLDARGNIRRKLQIVGWDSKAKSIEALEMAFRKLDEMKRE
jgi:hypothetical protein